MKAITSFTDFQRKGVFMTKNIGGIERIVRIVAGLILIALAATGTVGLWGWLGLVPMATGLMGWCPPYSLLGINTCQNRNT
jgi:O-antigen ligase